MEEDGHRGTREMIIEITDEEKEEQEEDRADMKTLIFEG
jgi:hypothetical protein